MDNITEAPYGAWKSPITADKIVADSIGLADPFFAGDDVYWIEGRPQDQGRNVVVRRTPDGICEDVTPRPFNVRTRVHEYGGGAATVVDGTLYFSNFADQRLYAQPPGGDPRPITPPAAYRYADGVIDRHRQRWIGVREDHTGGEAAPVNAIVAVDLAHGGSGTMLVQGNDFYSSPRLSPSGGQLAWLTWSHPRMPWIGTELWLADIAADGTLSESRKIAGGEAESVFQPEWSPDGQLYFVSDRSGWWNLYHWNEQQGREEPLYPMQAEFGQAQWRLGMSTYAFADADTIVCAYVERGLSRLAKIDVPSRRLQPIDLPYTAISFVRANGDKVVFHAGSPIAPDAIVSLQLSSGTIEILRAAFALTEQDPIGRYFSAPRAVEFPTVGGKTAHAFYYPPCNPDYPPPAGERPPLVVRCHGGPTAAASSALNLSVQYWTSRGIAVLDVNYGGSTGYGREYRNRLHLSWGVVDVDDCANGATWLAGQGLADAERMVIMGGSAGGYTALAALAFRDIFKGGASHYGVSDLSALARDTHKFESHYLDWLVGPYPAEQDLYRERSPVYAADRIKAPVIFFQGDEDKIVPPSQTEVMVDALRKNRITVGYLLFAGEQHGFRRGANIQRSLDAALYFFASQVFKTALTF